MRDLMVTETFLHDGTRYPKGYPVQVPDSLYTLAVSQGWGRDPEPGEVLGDAVEELPNLDRGRSVELTPETLRTEPQATEPT